MEKKLSNNNTFINSRKISQIIKESTDLKLESFVFPDETELSEIIEEKKFQQERERIINDKDVNDPLSKAKEEAHRLLQEAQENYKNMELEASLLKKKQEDNIREKLRKEFQQKLEQEVNTNTAELKERYINSIQEIAVLKEKLLNDSQQTILSLIKILVKKIINVEIREKEGIIINLLKRSLDKLKGFKEATIYINSQDYKYIVKKINEIKTSEQSIKFIEDENMSRGDCKIISEKGQINSRISEIEEIMFRELG